MKTVARCFDLFEAERFRLILANSDIAAFIPDETCATVAPYFLLSSGVRVQVADEHAEAAERIIGEQRHAGSVD